MSVVKDGLERFETSGFFQLWVWLHLYLICALWVLVFFDWFMSCKIWEWQILTCFKSKHNLIIHVNFNYVYLMQLSNGYLIQQEVRNSYRDFFRIQREREREREGGKERERERERERGRERERKREGERERERERERESTSHRLVSALPSP